MAYNLRLAGLEDGYTKSERELEDELKAIRTMVLGAGELFLPDAFQSLPDLAHDRRLLIVERIEHGIPVIHGCIAYEIQWVCCVDPVTGEKFLQRVIMLRLLVVRESPDRAELARRLALEAQLRGTVRARCQNEDAPHVLGALGVMMAQNGRALGWARNLGERVIVLSGEALALATDPALVYLRRFAEAKRASLELDQGYVFVVANRLNLIEAADLHLEGRDVYLTGNHGFAIRYDPTDPCSPWIDMAVANLAARDPATLTVMGLRGNRIATPWGPPARDTMRLGVDGDWDGWEDFSH